MVGWGELVVLDGTLNSQRYTTILRDSVPPWAIVCLPGRQTFLKKMYMARTMPCPTQHVTQLIFWHKRMWRSCLSTQSPDMNPIEHVWDQMADWIQDLDDPPPPLFECAVSPLWVAITPFVVILPVVEQIRDWAQHIYQLWKSNISKLFLNNGFLPNLSEFWKILHKVNLRHPTFWWFHNRCR